MSSKKSNSNSSSKSSTRSTTSRTVNVSADGGPARAMTPEAAARYLQQATTNSNNREVKISFGPSRPPPPPPPTSHSRSSNRTAAGSGSAPGRSSAMSFGSLDLQALKETAAAAAAAQRGGSLAAAAAPDGLPCSEAEMKALMGMFVEIMGMSMDQGGKPGNNSKSNHHHQHHPNGGNNRKNAPTNNPMFMFGNQPLPNGSSTAPWPDQESLAAATAGFFADGASWEAIRRTYGAVYHGSSDAYSNDYDDDDDDENESIPDLDDMCNMLDQQAGHQGENSAKSAIAPGDWESLEKVAVEDALEAEEQLRRVAKKREKKQRRKQKQKDEIAAKAAEAAEKKREKTILSWRSRVVSACQSGELPKLEALLQESPWNGKSSDDGENIEKSEMQSHLEFLLPTSIAKNRTQLERGAETRHRLASYILSLELELAFVRLRNGRTALHTACFQGDVSFVELVLEHLDKFLEENRSRSNARGTSRLSREDLNVKCLDSGWTPLHYAAVSGSTDMLEVLLRAGCDAHTVTNDTHTRRGSDGSGVTPRELIEYIQAGTFEKVLESHGVALQEVQTAFLGNHDDRRNFMRILEKATKRLKDVEANGYIAPGLLEMTNSFGSEVAAGVENDDQADVTGAKKRKKKKKKKKQTGKESEVSEETTTVSTLTASVPLPAAKQEPAEDFEDPLVTALLGMGFTKEQISAAVKACGGTNRATADDLVTWILGQDADGIAMEENTSTAQSRNSVEAKERTVVKTKVADDTRLAADENRQKQEAARRLAEKKEEQRRKNREWNNREQARQQQEVKAKTVQAMAPPASRPQAAIPPGAGAAFPTIPGAGAAGLQTAAATYHIANAPIALKVTNPVPVKAMPVAGIERDFPVLSQTSYQVPMHKIQPTPVAAAPQMTSHNSFPPIGDDERTVSSFGSNIGLSVSSAPFLPPGMAPVPAMTTASSLAPPGFMKPAPPGMGSHPPLAEEEMESGSIQSGEIRATAREFVPKGYTPPPRAQARIPEPMVNVPPSLSRTFGPALGVPLSSSLPEVTPPFHGGAIPFSQGFLGSAGPPPPTNPALLGGGPMAYDRIPPVTPVSEATSPSISSSMAGLPGLEDPMLSSGLGHLGFGMEQQPQASNTPSLLSSTFTNGPSLRGDSIWGGGGSSHQTTPSMTGLPPINFGVDSGANFKEGEGEDSSNMPLPGSWGGPNLSGGGLSGGQGIW